MHTPHETPVIDFVQFAWDHAGGNPFSWTLYNQQVRQTCHIAAAGFRWREGDLDKLVGFHNSRYTILKALGENAIEWLYTTAVKAANMSACIEIERFLRRPAIIADGANNRQRDRLCLESVFTYDFRELRVTSFDDDGRAICVPVTKEDGKRKLYCLSPADIKRDRAKRKKD